MAGGDEQYKSAKSNASILTGLVSGFSVFLLSATRHPLSAVVILFYFTFL
jgi:hypothetical protein